jgi:TonB family protein
MSKRLTDSKARRWFEPSFRPAAALLCLCLAASAASAQATPAGEPYRVGGPVSRPQLISQSKAVYTEEARKVRLTGTVILEVVIDERGNVTGPLVRKGLPMGLDRKAVEAVQTWKFKPATLEGKPVPVYYTLTVDFRLDDAGQQTGQSGQAQAVRSEGGPKPEKILGRRAVPTEASIEAGVWGDVTVDVEIDEKGNVVDAKVVKGLPMGLDQQALDAVHTWKFKPATQDGRPIKVRTNVTVSFAKPAARQ